MRGLKLALTLTLLLTGTLLHGQHYLGVRGGYAGGMIRLTPRGNNEPGLQWGLYSGGLSWKFFTESKIVGGVQVDLQYIGKGYMYEILTADETAPTESYHRTYNAFELPFMWQPHFYAFQRKMRIFFNLGVNFSYHLNAKEWRYSEAKGVYDEQPYPLKLTRDNKLGYGLTAGFGFSVLAGRWDITLEGRYMFGFSDIMRNSTIYESNPSRSPVDQINISLGAYYRLGKGGLRSAPSPKMEQRMAEAEARRILRRREKGKDTGGVDLAPLDSILRLDPADSLLRQRIDSLLTLPNDGSGIQPLTPSEEPPQLPETPAEETAGSSEALKPETP